MMQPVPELFCCMGAFQIFSLQIFISDYGIFMWHNKNDVLCGIFQPHGL